jgi:hypothetical protein
MRLSETLVLMHLWRLQKHGSWLGSGVYGIYYGTCIGLELGFGTQSQKLDCNNPSCGGLRWCPAWKILNRQANLLICYWCFRLILLLPALRSLCCRLKAVCFNTELCRTDSRWLVRADINSSVPPIKSTNARASILNLPATADPRQVISVFRSHLKLPMDALCVPIGLSGFDASK